MRESPQNGGLIHLAPKGVRNQEWQCKMPDYWDTPEMQKVLALRAPGEELCGLMGQAKSAGVQYGIRVSDVYLLGEQRDILYKPSGTGYCTIYVLLGEIPPIGIERSSEYQLFQDYKPTEVFKTAPFYQVDGPWWGVIKRDINPVLRALVENKVAENEKAHRAKLFQEKEEAIAREQTWADRHKVPLRSGFVALADPSRPAIEVNKLPLAYRQLLEDDEP